MVVRWSVPYPASKNRKLLAIFRVSSLKCFFERGSFLRGSAHAEPRRTAGRPLSRPPRKVVPFSGRSPIIPFFFCSSPSSFSSTYLGYSQYPLLLLYISPAKHIVYQGGKRILYFRPTGTKILLEGNLSIP